MELVFQEEKLEYLRRILHDTVVQEQTAELIVPDSMPDANRVVDAFGTVLIRSEDCSPEGISVAGTVQAGVIFVTENGEIRSLETQLPFSVRRDMGGEILHCGCSLRSVDARMLNSRKLLVRVGIVCSLLVYSKAQQTLYDMAEPAPTLQLKRRVLPLQLPVAVGEKSFVLNEEMELPEGKPSLVRMLKCVWRTQVLEQKFVGSKGVFKGELVLHVLYEDANEELQVQQTALPFSQFVEMPRELDECRPVTALSLTSAEAEPDGQIDCRRILLSVNLTAHCTAMGECRVPVIEDAYCTDAELTPQWSDWSADSLLDQQEYRETVVAESDAPAGRMVDAWIYPDEPVCRREGEKMTMELPLSCNVVYVDPEGNLQGRTMRPTTRVQAALAEQASCELTGFSVGECFCKAGAGGMELRCPVTVQVSYTATERLHTVSGGEVTQLPKEGKRPSVILRRTEDNEDIWELAKSCRTSMEAVQEANGLQGDRIPAGTMLLIPM